MTFDEYQEKAAETAIYPGKGEGQLLYPALGAVDEACELLEVVEELLDEEIAGVLGKPDLLLGMVEAAINVGAVLGAMKKAHRDNEGLVARDKLGRIGMLIQLAMSSLDRAWKAIGEGDYPVEGVSITLPTVAVPDELRARLLKECGDGLWYQAAILDEAKLSMGDAAAANLAKLADRKARGVLGGSGDDR